MKDLNWRKHDKMNQQTVINIRPAVPGDSMRLLSLMHQHAEFEEATKPSISTDKLASVIRDGAHIQIWVAADSEKLIGYFSLTQDYSTWSGEKYLHLDCLFLHKDYRKQGLGRQLLTKIKGIARSLKVKQIQWQTPIENTIAIQFYKHQGAVYKVKSRFTLEL